MIPLSTHFDLGLDTTRIKDQRDADRQCATAQSLLSRLFHDDREKRWELQVLADEVGMGKTFVALAVAYSLLERLLAGKTSDGLDGCYQKVVILAPPNGALLNKWYREVSEFVSRCVRPEHRAEAEKWFRPSRAERLDDFVRLMRRPGTGGRLVVAPMDVFGERKLQGYDLKRRFLLGALFRYWGNRLQVDRRERLLLGSPYGWPKRPDELSVMSEYDTECLPCSEEEAIDSIARFDRADTDGPSAVEALLQECRDISEPYTRDRDQLFERISKRLNSIYREMVLSLLMRPVPLLIVDEAHNWKNGPSNGTNGYELFAKYLASRTRRALLLTATPFQLRPAEMLELLRIGENLQPLPERSGANDRCERLRNRRENVLAPVLANADESSRKFARAWSKLRGLDTNGIEGIWASDTFRRERVEITALADAEGVIPVRELDRLVVRATADLDPALRSFFATALTLYAHNRDLSAELGPVVVRHRRKTEHRVFRVGHEYGGAEMLAEKRPDRQVLHASPGLDVCGEPELPHYLLMRCISDTKKGVGRSSLGSALTGCYSTLLESAEGQMIKKWIAGNPANARHFHLLLELVNRRQDPKHPKVAAVVEEVVKAWQRGEKTLLFCFRTNTAERLHEIIRDRIEKELSQRRRKCLGGEASLVALRGRLTRRDGDLITLGLDRVLWSMAASDGFGDGWPFEPEVLRVEPDDLRELARACLRHGVDLESEKPDRIFLSRAIDHVISRRLLHQKPQGLLRVALEQIADERWVEWSYGHMQGQDRDDDVESGEGLDLRGVQRHFPVERPEPNMGAIRELADSLEKRRARARSSKDTSIIDADADAPSLWFGGSPSRMVRGMNPLVDRLHRHLAALSKEGGGKLDWDSRSHVFGALRRVLLRDSVLVRLLPSKADRDERAWGDLLVEAFWRPITGQKESMAHKIEVFLEDLRGASGSFEDPSSARASILDATKLRGQRFVALVKGGDQKGRERAFVGFNTPLLPEVLVCTSVGAEGIDLHRHCRHIVHYDLAWNPAVLEQRTGRIDRIGSKTFRERVLSTGGDATFLEVGVPFLAGTYDERMYEELRLRAQIFEVLTGGDLAGDDVEGRDDQGDAEGREIGLQLIPLPPSMMDDVRVHLHVWEDNSRR